MSVKIGQLGDHYDPTIDPRFSKVGKQVCKDTGPLTKARMVTRRSRPLLALSGHRLVRRTSAFDPADIGRVRLTSDLAKVASAAGFVDTDDDQNERGCHEHPTRMATARRPKVAESANREPCVLLEPVCSGD